MGRLAEKGQPATTFWDTWVWERAEEGPPPKVKTEWHPWSVLATLRWGGVMLKERSEISPSESLHREVSDPSRHIEMVAQRRFDKSGYPALRRLSCHCDGRRLVIRGQVSSYYEKQIAQASLRDLSENLEIVNEAEVLWPTYRVEGTI